MAFKAYLKADNDVLLPAVLGLAVISLTIIALYLLRRRKVTAQPGGSKYVTSSDGSQVRRSTRCDILVASLMYGACIAVSKVPNDCHVT